MVLFFKIVIAVFIVLLLSTTNAITTTRYKPENKIKQQFGSQTARRLLGIDGVCNKFFLFFFFFFYL